MSAVKVALEQSCWTANYLLAHCEGYCVESDEGKLGYVEEVVWAPDGSELLALRVYGNQGRATVMIGDVLELHPRGERIVVCTPTGQADQTADQLPERLDSSELASVLMAAVHQEADSAPSGH